jgi:PAS domain S-box-containing protein
MRAATRFRWRLALAAHPMSDDRLTHCVLDPTEEQFHMLVDTVQEYAIYMLDPTGNVVTWNLGAQKIKQYTAEEIIGKNFACFYIADDVAAEKPQRNLREAVAKGHMREQGLRVRKDGSTFHAEVVITALRDRAGNIRGFSKVTRDVTDQIRGRETEAAKIAAEKASKAKDDFLAALSHELRTPLTPALAAANYLADNAVKLPSEFVEEVEIIKRNVRLQARLIDDLLDLTRITRGKLNLHFKDVDVHILVCDAIEIADSTIAAKKLKLYAHLNAEEHYIRADSIRIQQVFWNLVNNAVKFTSPGGKIDIRTSNDDRGRFQFEIIDNGIGIEVERQASLFAPFEQADPSIRRQFGGLGLGLAISKYLVNLHGGTIEVHSRGRSYGSTFKLSLDAVTKRTQKNGVDSQTPRKPAKSLRILLVEDHSDTRRTLSRLLSHFGHQISVADNTQSALEIVQSQQFDVVLSDIGLPDGSGYEVITQAKRKQPIKAVAITGFGTDEDVRRGKQAGFDFHLVKPIDFHELRSVLDQVGA